MLSGYVQYIVILSFPAKKNPVLDQVSQQVANCKTSIYALVHALLEYDIFLITQQNPGFILLTHISIVLAGLYQTVSQLSRGSVYPI
jgi:hypothetical protein